MSTPYDLVSNRQSEVHTGPAGGAGETIRYAYDSRDELTSQSSSLHGSTINSYDANGSLTTSTTNGQTNTYAYDVRNKMTGATVNGVTSSDVYDDAGNRVSETVNGVTTFYLTDNNNPTGYAQPIEERSTPSGPPGITYLIGDHVFGQAKANAGVTYFITDGHGSTAAVTSSAAAVISVLTYDAFGTALNFSANTPPTIFLFGGDAVWDPATSLYLNGDGTRGRDGTAFVESDSQGYANNTEPTTLHKYLYAGGNPVMYSDPSGHDFIETLAVIGIQTANFAIRAYPVIKIGLAAWDAVTITKVHYTGFTEGFDKVSASDWVQFGLSTIGLFGLAPGSELLAKTVLSTFLHIPIGPALRTFEGARLAVGQFVKLEEVAVPLAETVDKITVGGFHVYESGTPVIRFYKTGNDLEDAGTLIHEFLHYTDWVLKGKPVGQAFEEFKVATNVFEKAHHVFDAIEKLILDLSK